MTGKFLRLCGASSLALATGLMTSPAFADHLEEKTIERMLVIGKRIGTPTAPGVKEMRKELARIPGAVSLIDADSYKDKYAYTLEDTLSFTPGVFAKKRFGEEVRLSVRGSGLSRGYHVRGIDILQNGIPYNVADGTGDFHEIDPLTAQHMEVYKGGDSLQYGAASLGGAINIVAPTAHTVETENQLRIEGGSYGTWRGHARIARIFDDADMFVSMTGSQSDGYRQQSKSKAARISSNFGYRFHENAETRFYLSYNAINNELPGTLSLAEALNTPKLASAGNLAGNQQRNVRSVRFANKTSLILDNGAQLDIGGYASYKNLFHPVFQVIDQASIDMGLFTRYAGEGTLFGHRNVLTLGAKYAHGSLVAKQFVNLAGSRGVQTQDGNQVADTFIVYGENQFFILPELALVTGLQVIHTSRDYTNQLVPARSDEDDYTSASPKLGLLWDITPEAQAYANVTRSFEPPTFGDLTQTGLAGIQFVPVEPQSAVTVEIGTRGHEGIATWDVSLYHTWLRNELINYTTNPDVPAATFNADKTIHRGIDAYLALDIGGGFGLRDDRLILEQAYTFSDFRFRHDSQYDDNKLAGQPPHLYVASLRYKSHYGWDIAPRIEWVPDGGVVDYANNLKAPGYALIGIEGGIDITNGVRFFIDARNLADRRYVSNYTAITNANTAATNVFYPGEGRSVFAGFTASF